MEGQTSFVAKGITTYTRSFLTLLKSRLHLVYTILETIRQTGMRRVCGEGQQSKVERDDQTKLYTDAPGN